MKIMTFNLRADMWFDGKNRWKHRKKLVFQLIKDQKCDIIGFQEVNKAMYHDLKEAFPDYLLIGLPRSRFTVGERNTLMISKKHKILKYKTFWLSSHPERKGSSIWYSFFPRICTAAKIQLETGTQLRVYNTHLDCYLSPARAYGLKIIHHEIQKQQIEEPLPTVLMGDFNTKPTERLLQTLLSVENSDLQFIAVQEIDPTLYDTATYNGFKGREKGLHLDYIFVSPDCEVKETQILKWNQEGRYPSDHYPLISYIEIP